MKKKYYLEVIRILAILMVMYNHSAAFMSFSNQSGVEYAISFLFFHGMQRCGAFVFHGIRSTVAWKK